MQTNNQSASNLVSAEWLEHKLGEPGISLVDASWHMPATGRDAAAEFEAGHIAGAVFFDIDKFSAKSELPHTLPSSAEFFNASAELGISSSDTLIVYDTTGIFSAARVWWMYRYYGAASNVYVLDGGLPAWKAAGGELVSGELVSGNEHTAVPLQTALPESHGVVVDASQVLQASSSADASILDARSHARFTGADKEPREGLRSGHIPGSYSLPFTQLLNNGCLKNRKELEQIFKSQGIDLQKPIITTCGSGVTAAVIILALAELGIDDAMLYDGSWSEWGGLPQMPVETG